MSFRRHLLTLLLGLAIGASGCFPDDQNMSSVSLQLSLEDLGIENASALIHDWQDWHDNGGPGSMVFDLGLDGRGFFLGLDLEGYSTDGQVMFTGRRVEVSDDLLTVDLDVTQCSDCKFSAVIFWEDSSYTDSVSTFGGESSLFNILPGVIPDVDLHVYLEPVGSIRCRPTNPDFQGEVTLAAMDVGEAVIFPSVTGTLDDLGIVLPSIPVNRKMNVLVWSLADGDYATAPVYLEVTVQEAGFQVDIAIDL